MSFTDNAEQPNQITVQKSHVIIDDGISCHNKKESNSTLSQKSTQSRTSNDNDNENTVVIPDVDGRRAWIVLGGFVLINLFVGIQMPWYVFISITAYTY